MAKFRVKAFFMHEHEAAAASRAEQASVMTDTEWTDEYVIAVVDESEIPNLVRQGLVITPVEIVETSGDPGTPRRATRGGGTRARGTQSQADMQGAKPLGRSLGSKSVAG